MRASHWAACSLLLSHLLLLPQSIAFDIRDGCSKTQWGHIITSQLEPFHKGISREMLDEAVMYIHTLRRQQGWHILIKDEVLYAKPIGDWVEDISAKQIAGSTEGYLNLILKFMCQGPLPDVEIVLRVSDLGSVPRGRGLPVFSYGKKWNEFDDILFPYWSFINTLSITTMHQVVPWAEKIETAIWRGSTTGGYTTDKGVIRKIGSWRNISRCDLVAHCNRIRNSSATAVPLCDAHFTAYVNLEEGEETEVEKALGKLVPQIPNEAQSRFKYIILADGNTVSAARSRSMLFSRSAIIKQTSQASEFFYPLLHPYVHYLPVAEDFHDLEEVLIWARGHDTQMQSMAENSRAWAEMHLLDKSVFCYVSHLLNRYHALQTFKPQLTPDLLLWRVNFTDVIRGWIGGETNSSCVNTSRHPVKRSVHTATRY